MNVTEFRGSDPRIGLAARNGAAGPEAELVEDFKEFVPACFRWQKGDVALFHEPQMDSGFPDLVAVQYMPKAFGWPATRFELKPVDLKVMHHLVGVKGADVGMLIGTLGVDPRALLGTLERLLDANMITRSGGKWMPKPLKSVFGLRAIVAVEAKIKNWPDAFQQGQLDQWFASQSYVLSPINSPGRRALERSRRTGVGILLLNGTRVRRLQSARKGHIPASYGSWMFNEWIGRRLHSG